MSCGRSVAYCCWLLCFAVIGVYNQYMPTMQCMQALESIWNCNDHFASIVRLFDCGIGGNSSTITIVLIFVFVFFLQRRRPTTCYTVSDGAFVVNAKSWWWNRCRRWIVTFSHFRMLSTTKKSYGKMSCSMPLPLVLRRNWIFSYAMRSRWIEHSTSTDETTRRALISKIFSSVTQWFPVSCQLSTQHSHW